MADKVVFLKVKISKQKCKKNILKFVVNLFQVDVDESEDVTAANEIESMPTFIFIKNMVKLDEFSGANEEKLLETIKKYV